MLRLGAGLTALLLVPLVGCAGEQESYCDAMAQEKQTLEDLSAGADDPEAGTLSETIAVFERLQEDAPDDMVDEWDTYVTALRALETALADAGADESMFTDGEKPEGMRDEDYDSISAAAVELRSTRVVEAAAGIEQHALDVCKISLSGSGLRQ
ncbi:MAG: hypothetical protein ACXWW7_12500 [Nocardioides sp.]